LWTFLWLPLVNLFVQTVYFVVMLGVSENQGNMIAQVYNFTLPSLDISVSQIFTWQLGGLFLGSLFFRYISFLFLTLPVPFVRFAILRRPVKSASLGFITAILTFAVGAALHSYFYAPLLDPKSGAMDIVVQIPEYATMLFAFLATLNLIRCDTASKGRWIKDADSYDNAPRQRAQMVPQRVAPPPRLTIEDSFPEQGGSTSAEDPSGTIISGSAHFGGTSPSSKPRFVIDASSMETPKIFGQENTLTAVPDPLVAPIEPPPVPTAAFEPPPPPPPPPAAPIAPPPVSSAMFASAPPISEPVELRTPVAPLPDNLVSLLLDEPAAEAPAPQREIPASAEAVSVPLPKDLVSLLKEIQITDSTGDDEADAGAVPPQTQPEPADITTTPETADRDEMSALFNEIETAADLEHGDENAIPTLDDLLSALKPQSPSGLIRAREEFMGLTAETAYSPDETQKSELLPVPGDFSTYGEIPKIEDSGESEPTLAQEEHRVCEELPRPEDFPEPEQEEHPAHVEVPEREQAGEQTSEDITAREEPATDEEQPPAEPSNPCLLCGGEEEDRECYALPNGAIIHQSCYDEVLEKLATLKTDEETMIYFQSSPNVMKVLFMANPAVSQIQRESGKSDE